MLEILENKKVIFFDVGYTLAYPASGDWVLTKKLYELAGVKIRCYSEIELQNAKDKSFEYLNDNLLVTDCDVECERFVHFYRELSNLLDLGLSMEDIREIAHDRTFNMANYARYPDAIETLETLSKTHKLGVISDTWPTIELQLESMGIRKYFSTTTYSCLLGTYKPDKRMYIDALEKMNIAAEDCVFIDDSTRNLEGAAKLGITPILIAANPVSDVDVPYQKIHTLKELIK